MKPSPMLRALLLVTLAVGTHCGNAVSPGGGGPLRDGGPLVGSDVVGQDVVVTQPDGSSVMTGPPVDPSQLDLLLEVDNSNSMTQNQTNLFAQLPTLINALVNPPDRNGDGVPDYPAITSLHVGVIDQDLGTPGSTVPGCENGDAGDDGLLNPIHFGQAELRHEPRASAPPGFRPASCSNDTTFYPAFITFASGVNDPTQFAADFQCNAGLYINGCGLEQQLEAIWRALIWHDASDRLGNTDPNAGFLRDAAQLEIIVLSDEEDMSTVDCRYIAPGSTTCPNTNALDVYNSASVAWSSSNLNLRTYLYQPCGAQDPTWPLERYIDPTNPSVGLLSLKPGHPEAVGFVAITGVPLPGDGFPTHADGTTNWDGLLGTPSASGPNDFCGRDATAAGMSVDVTSSEGHVSMRQANADPNCSARVVPACRRQGTVDNPAMPACATTEQYFAWPARRIVEVARRFDQSPFCAGGPCHRGAVASICGADYSAIVELALAALVSR